MREILFRGKRPHDGKWIYGDLTHDPNGKESRIRTYDMELNGLFMVMPETVGQYTSLKDKNGKRIFEGDIVRASNYLHPSRTIYVARFDDIGYYLFDEDGTGWHHANLEDVEVIGNIHDNPELLEGVKDEH